VHISVILVEGNVINVLAVDSIGAWLIAMTAPACPVQCGGITNASVERQWRRNCAQKRFSSARGNAVGCWIAGSIGVRGGAMGEGVENAHFEVDGLVHVGRKIIQG
jgi:hypothetical protein